MNIRKIVRGAVQTVNADIVATLYRSTGSTVVADFSQAPTYAPPVQVCIQVQALTGHDLKQIDLINQQGILRAVYLPGEWAGLIRADQKGGDKMVFNGHTWLITQVLENWPGWTKVVACQQISA